MRVKERTGPVNRPPLTDSPRQPESLEPSDARGMLLLDRPSVKSSCSGDAEPIKRGCFLCCNESDDVEGRRFIGD